MPNHFHFLIRQIKDNGVSIFISHLTNSYTKYFNTKYKRVGPLFQGEFKAVLIDSDEQLMHISRYIHLNPYVSNITKDWETFAYSSFQEFIEKKKRRISSPSYILSLFKDLKEYKAFVRDQESYAKEIEKIKHLLIEKEE